MSNSKIIIGLWVYTALIAVTILNDKLSFFNLIFSVGYVSICFFYALNVVRKSREVFYIFCFSIVYLIYVLLSPEFSNSLNSKWGMMNWTLKVMLTFFPAYYYGKKGVISQRYLRFASIGFVVVGLISYYLNINLIILSLVYSEEGMTNNVGYLFVAILPLLFINIKKNIILIILSYIFILISLKRGAIICAIVTIPFFIYLARKEFHLNRKVIGLGILLVSILLINVVKNVSQSNTYIEKRIEMTMEGNSSGRDTYAFIVFDTLEKYDFMEIVLGKGINYSMVILDNFAHNDWLEIMLSMGLVGCFFYLLSFLGMVLYARKDCFQKYRIIGYMIILLIFVRTIISMNYFSLDSIPFYYTLGIICNRKSNLCVKS